MDINAPVKTYCSLGSCAVITPQCCAAPSAAEIQATGERAGYLMQLIVFLQDQSDDVTHEGDFPLGETSLQELLLAQHRLVVENIPQRLASDIKTAEFTTNQSTSAWTIFPFSSSGCDAVTRLVKRVGKSEVTLASELEPSCHQLLGKRRREGGEGEARDGEEGCGVALGEAAR